MERLQTRQQAALHAAAAALGAVPPRAPASVAAATAAVAAAPLIERSGSDCSCATSADLAAAAARTAAAGASSGQQAAAARRSSWLAPLAGVFRIEVPSTLKFAEHLWQRCAARVDWQRAAAQQRARAGNGAPAGLTPPQLAFGVCLWLAAKLEERRVRLPTAGALAGALGISAAAVNALELELMDLLAWRPYAHWPPAEDAAAAAAAAPAPAGP